MLSPLQALVGMPQLGLRVLAAEAGLSRQVTWVAVSELEDPTPFLEGGELLLTTGMRLSSTASQIRGYVDRLVAAGVVGLGLGVGLGHDAAPATLVRAAERRGLPLLEVPRPTPFIAISKAVSDLLAAEQSEAARRAFEAQRELTRAALLPERSGAVVARLAREVAGWAAMLDASGRLLHSCPSAEPERLASLGPELDRLRSKGLLASSTLADRDEQIVIQPLGVGRRTRGFLVVAVRPPVSTVHHTIVNAAVSLLSLDLEKSTTQLDTERRLRSALIALMLAGSTDDVRQAAELLGGSLPTSSARMAIVACPERQRGDVLDALEDGVSLRQLGVLAAVVGAEIVVTLPAGGEAEQALVAVAKSRPHCRVGIGGLAEVTGLATSLRQAEQALAAGRREGRAVSRYDDLSSGPLLDLLDADAVRGFASALLAPLDAYEGPARTDLVASLRAYLAHNGQWDPAAAELGVHRHTLRYRMRRIAELLGRDVDSASNRMELMLALTARDRIEPSVTQTDR